MSLVHRTMALTSSMRTLFLELRTWPMVPSAGREFWSWISAVYTPKLKHFLQIWKSIHWGGRKKMVLYMVIFCKPRACMLLNTCKIVVESLNWYTMFQCIYCYFNSIVYKKLPAGQGRYQVRMVLYQDAEFSQPFSGSMNVEVNQQMFVEVRVEGVDSRQFATVIDKFWATPANEPHQSIHWDLISRE